MTPAELLIWSDERDQWERRILALETRLYAALDAADDWYRAGFLDGREAEQHRARAAGRRTLRGAGEKIAPAYAAPDIAELERRRWGPGGRESHLVDRAESDNVTQVAGGVPRAREGGHGTVAA